MKRLMVLWLLVGTVLAAACSKRGASAGDDTDTATDTATDTDTDTESDSSCTPGEYSCIDDSVYFCTDPEGVSEYVETCEEPYECVDGECVYSGPVVPLPETCEQAELGHSTVGCRFFAVDMDMVDPYDNSQYAIVVSNVQLATPAVVTVEVQEDDVWTEVEPPMTIEALGTGVFEVPDRHVDGSGFLAGGAYRVTSDVPIGAYQFNPYIADGSWTSDASLLFPVPAWDSVHYILGQQHVSTQLSAYLTVIASVDGTTITVTPSVDTMATVEIPQGFAGAPFTVDLDEGDVAQIAVAYMGGNLTGTLVTSDEDHPIGVLTGHTCVEIPQDTGACDHLQEQLSGVHRWGWEYVAARMPVRSTEEPIEPNHWQIIAAEDQTTVQITASDAVFGVPEVEFVLDAGEYWEGLVSGTLEEPGDFHISADKPIAVASYMTCAGMVNPDTDEDPGDPSQVQMAAVEHYLERYVVLVPYYWTYDVATVIRTAGIPVELDGAPIDDVEFFPVGSSYEVARVIVEDGAHTFSSGEGFSVFIVGFDDDDSYAYLAGTGTYTSQ